LTLTQDGENPYNKYYLRYADSPWLFLTECCFSKDQTDTLTPIKKLPSWAYLEFYTYMWEKNRLLAVPKSRRMTMSWTTIALYLWDALYHPVRSIAFVSKKEDDSAELIRRAEFIYDHIPPEVKQFLPKKDTGAKPPRLSFPEIKSEIQGFPQGADQLRQFTFSGILGDECAFWEEARRFYSSAFPTIEGGGRMTLISSRSPGFFQRLCYDQLDNEDSIDESKTPPQKRPFKDDSVIVWHNPKNKFCIMDIHYTANPRKRDPAFRDAVRASMPIKDFLVEYERNWDTYDGTPVFEDYSKQLHEVSWIPDAHLGLPLLVGWDFGLTPAAIVAQLQGDRLILLKEFTSQNKGIKQFCPIVMNSLKQLYPEWNDMKRDFIHYIDPAGLQRMQSDSTRSCAVEMASQGLKNIFPGPVNWEERRKAVEHFLTSHTKEGPGLLLNPGRCPKLAKGFSGAYRYPEKYLHIEPGNPSPIKDEYSHPHDALQYLCGGALALLKKHATVIEIPRPSYGFEPRPERGEYGEEKKIQRTR